MLNCKTQKQILFILNSHSSTIKQEIPDPSTVLELENDIHQIQYGNT